MKTLALMATPRRHTNVLQHMAGYFKRLIDTDSRQELAATIEDYRLGLVPLIVPDHAHQAPRPRAWRLVPG